MSPAGYQAREFDFPENFDAYTRYLEAPFHIKGKFIEHIKQTNQPETFPGLYWGGGLRKDDQFEEIHDFAVDGKKRPDGTLIPCPMCKHREKFLEGFLVYIPRIQCIAVIGNKCATADVRQAAKSKYEAENARRQAEDFLLPRLPAVTAELKQISEMKSLATAFEKIHADFRRGAPSIQNALRQVQKAGGNYIAVEARANPAAAFDKNLPREIIESRPYGLLRGERLVAPKISYLADLRRLESWLTPYAGCQSEEEAMDMTIDLVSRGKAAEAVKYLTDARTKRRRIRKDFVELCAFFTEQHVNSLHGWANDRANPMPFNVGRQMRSDGTAVSLAMTNSRGKREYARLLLPHSLSNWAEANAHYDTPELRDD